VLHFAPRRSMGEKQIEIDKRILRNRMAFLRKELDEVIAILRSGMPHGLQAYLGACHDLVPPVTMSSNVLVRHMAGEGAAQAAADAPRGGHHPDHRPVRLYQQRVQESQTQHLAVHSGRNEGAVVVKSTVLVAILSSRHDLSFTTNPEKVFLSRFAANRRC